MATLSVFVQIDYTDAEKLDLATRQLRSELLALDVDDVRLTGGNTPLPGAKGDASSIGSLVVDLANSAGLAALFQLISTWVTRSHGRTITIEDGNRRMTIDGAKVEQHQQIIDAFLSAENPESKRDDS